MPPSYQGQRIYVADDEDDIREYLGTLLTLSFPGLQVGLAENGQQLLDMMREQLPSLIILDLKMPVLNGFKTLEQLRASDETRHIPVIVLTGFGHEEMEPALKRSGANFFLSKPIPRESLLEKIRGVLGE